MIKEFKTFEIATTVVDAIGSNFNTTIPIEYSATTLFSLQELLSSFRGGNDALLAILETKMRASFGFNTLNQELNLDYPAAAEDAESFQEDWISEGILSQGREAISTAWLGTSGHEGQTPWVSTGLTTIFGRPSPLQILLDLDAQGATDEASLLAPET